MTNREKILQRRRAKKDETREETLARLGVVELTDPWGHTTFRTANKEANVAPRILREYSDEGVRMYECEGERHFIADAYDKGYKPSHNKKLITGRIRGEGVSYSSKKS